MRSPVDASNEQIIREQTNGKEEVDRDSSGAKVAK